VRCKIADIGSNNYNVWKSKMAVIYLTHPIHGAKVAVLDIEAGSSLLLDKEKIIEAARRQDLCIVGVVTP
jgi:hypothetical protein